MFIIIKGAGDLASGVALRFHNAGFQVVMTDLPRPTAIRRTVAFSSAIANGEAEVEGVKALFAKTPDEAMDIVKNGKIAVLADEKADCVTALHPPVLIDAILAKYNTGTKITDAPVVVALGPGFTAGEDCNAVVETKRRHHLGRIYYSGSANPNTGKPGNIEGFTEERIVRAPCAGVFSPRHSIGDIVEAGEIVAEVDGTPVNAPIYGVLRGILPDKTLVTKGMKSGDVDPRGIPEYCHIVSDKARAVAGGALEAVLHLTIGMKK